MKTLEYPVLVAGLFLIFVTGIARGTVTEFTALLSGPAESPPNASTGTGFADVIYDSIAQSLRVEVTFSGLSSPDTASHIHATTTAPFTGTAGVATTVPTFPGFPTGVTAGSYDQTLDLTSASSFNPAFVTANGGTVAGAEAALVAALFNGEAYLNIHTVTSPGGEIRGFLRVPDNSTTVVLLALGLLAIRGLARRQRVGVV